MITSSDFNAIMRRRGLPTLDDERRHTTLAQAPGRTMNATETAYADELEKLRLAGEIIGYVPQPMKLILADRTSYCPDFLVLLKDGRVRFDEIKGWDRPTGAAKFKIAARLFPHCGFRMIKRIDGKWKVTREYPKPAAAGKGG